MEVPLESVHDESHARALLKGWLRKYKKESLAVLARNWPEPPTGRNAAFKQVTRLIKAAIGEGMIADLKTEGGKGRRKKYVAFWLEPLEISSFTGEVNLTMNIPICVIIVDPKHPNKNPVIRKPYLLSEHLLCRVIQRTNCRSLTDLAEFFLPLMVLLIDDCMIDRYPKEHFIYLFEDGYYATIYNNDQRVLVFKTWVPAGRWTPKNKAKLSLLAARLREGKLAVRISERDFRESAVLAPEVYLKDAIQIG